MKIKGSIISVSYMDMEPIFIQIYCHSKTKSANKGDDKYGSFTGI